MRCQVAVVEKRRRNGNLDEYVGIAQGKEKIG